MKPPRPEARTFVVSSWRILILILSLIPILLLLIDDDDDDSIQSEEHHRRCGEMEEQTKRLPASWYTSKRRHPGEIPMPRFPPSASALSGSCQRRRIRL
ncbi:unnamed protein product [Merluccius merluccius]